ncbi:hypothetical protein [Actinoplanes teichomyceticus]|uniref:Uncharacterized protein n=1 Tax=Actinoplanes teichomyceticus TaxID=1867 RepID=A0A561VKV4_ACTTI|nr:hypothetical protein [Actinoplanes teichomyceticus]TWG12217.1 hypothetical protein FHX34_10584 [Actinoplanes teichomyceticus]GIF14151.1 hypothetical protein Ate01nite_41830 [Actinoplanes teichomyceticus]
MRDVDVVWRRGCANRGGGVGDRHLGALLLVHGAMMTGGAGLACAGCSPADFEAAAAACEYFGLGGLARLFRELPAATGSEYHEQRLNDAFRDMDPQGVMVPAAFEQRYAEAPGDFDPVPRRRFLGFGRRLGDR